MTTINTNAFAAYSAAKPQQFTAATFSGTKAPSAEPTIQPNVTLLTPLKVDEFTPKFAASKRPKERKLNPKAGERRRRRTTSARHGSAFQTGVEPARGEQGGGGKNGRTSASTTIQAGHKRRRHG